MTTLLPCGREVVAQEQPEDTPVGRLLGYTDGWGLTRDHDPGHLGLSRFVGLSSSPALERLAHEDGMLASDELVALEEEAVRAMLAFRNRALLEGWGLGSSGCGWVGE